MATDFAALLYIRAKSQMLAKLSGHTLLACLIWVRPFYCVRITNVGAFLWAVGCGMWNADVGCGMWDAWFGSPERKSASTAPTAAVSVCLVCLETSSNVATDFAALLYIRANSQMVAKLSGHTLLACLIKVRPFYCARITNVGGFLWRGMWIDYSDVRCGMWDVGYGI